jgi:hypothetical protein
MIVSQKPDFNVNVSLSPCPHCGGTETRTGAGRKPQEASLHCRECKRFIKWIEARELKRIIANQNTLL